MLPLLMNGVLLVLGALMLREFRIAMLSIRALRWRSTTGTLTDTLGDGHGTGTTEGLTFSYRVDDENYSSQLVGYGYTDQLGRIIARGDLGKVLKNAPTVDVYYDPRQPEISVLMNGFKTFHALRMLIVLVLFVAVWVLVAP